MELFSAIQDEKLHAGRYKYNFLTNNEQIHRQQKSGLRITMICLERKNTTKNSQISILGYEKGRETHNMGREGYIKILYLNSTANKTSTHQISAVGDITLRFYKKERENLSFSGGTRGREATRRDE